MSENPYEDTSLDSRLTRPIDVFPDAGLMRKNETDRGLRIRAIELTMQARSSFMGIDKLVSDAEVIFNYLLNGTIPSVPSTGGKPMASAPTAFNHGVNHDKT